MSFILDALRKSEAERQQQATPGLATTRYEVTAKSRNRWIPVLAVVLVANLAGIGYVLLRERAVTPGAAPAAEPAEAAGALPLTRVRSLSREAAPLPPPGAPAAAKRTGTAADTQAADAPAPRPPAVTGAALPSLQQLASEGVLSLPPLNIDIHVFSKNAEERFVFINMNKYREGQVLREGPTVEEITANGVVLNHRGSRFFLDRG